MMENIDWSKAPEGATHYNPMCGDWYQVSGESVYCWCSHNGWNSAFAWKSRKDYCITRPQPTSWNGQGLPPVGTVCEVKSTARGAEREWFKAAVNYSSPYTTVLDDYQAGEFVAHPAALQFRPIRTPEQVAKDEREAAIKEMTASYAENSEALAGWAAYVYDTLGYRKP